MDDWPEGNLETMHAIDLRREGLWDRCNWVELGARLSDSFLVIQGCFADSCSMGRDSRL